MKHLLLATLMLAGTVHAYEAQVKKGGLAPDLNAFLEKAKADTGVDFPADKFELIEERNLATSQFKMYVQTTSKIPVAKTAIRIWSDLKTKELILGEMHLDEKTQTQSEVLAKKYTKAKFTPGSFKSKQLSVSIKALISKELRSHPTDSQIISMKSQDMWSNGDLVREVEVRARRGVHYITVSLLRNKIIERSYTEFPQSESFTTLQANVFPIYEEVENTGERLKYEIKDLKYIKTEIPDGGDAPLGDLTSLKLGEDKYNPLLAETAYGEGVGVWSEASIRRKVEAQIAKLPRRKNDLASGLLLQGKYATINLHPAVKEQFKDVNFPLKASPNHLLSWTVENDQYVVSPLAGLLGKTISSQDELSRLLPVRLPDHNPTSYINSGFDEVQVYYGVTVLMDVLTNMGFTDPVLSTEPFHAFLYDPDISMRDNAYYYDNTINFTTYNPTSPNLARDNPTIWHELGHAIMDRLMGAHLGYADSKGGYGGLSEGMADFVAKIVVEEQTNTQPFPGKNDFRIINKTGLYLTNEFHDEGEAYGGAMNDMLLKVIRNEGSEGIKSFADLTLEAMRLTRNHPKLSASSWFQHMLYADELGSDVRNPGHYSPIILNALKERNFSFSSVFTPAKMDVKFGDIELTSSSDGSRDKPNLHCGTEGTVDYDLKVKLSAGDAQFLTFPSTVKVEYKKGALQGAIKWVGEEQNPQVYTINSADEVLSLPIKANMTCETINQPDGSCKDYAYIQVYNQGDLKPKAKKRFYLKIGQKDCAAVSI